MPVGGAGAAQRATAAKAWPCREREAAPSFSLETGKARAAGGAHQAAGLAALLRVRDSNPHGRKRQRRFGYASDTARSEGDAQDPAKPDTKSTFTS